MCRLPGNIGEACATGDAGGGRDVTADDTACWPGVTPSNFDPCAPGFPTALASYMFIGTQIFDTDQGLLGAQKAPGGLYPYGGKQVWLLHVSTLAFGANAALMIRGDLPLLIVSEGAVTISIPIDATAAAATPCENLDGASNADSGTGGGGGGFGAMGGMGGTQGDAMGATPGARGPVHGSGTLIPLRPGCPGGAGGFGGLLKNHGGNGGGALEIASATMIDVTGKILAGGGGGDGGDASAMGCVNGCGQGGAGGGAGGAILLEAPTVTIESNASVCATGGGGGGGGAGRIRIHTNTTLQSGTVVPPAAL